MFSCGIDIALGVMGIDAFAILYRPIADGVSFADLLYNTGHSWGITARV